MFGINIYKADGGMGAFKNPKVRSWPALFGAIIVNQETKMARW